MRHIEYSIRFCYYLKWDAHRGRLFSLFLARWLMQKVKDIRINGHVLEGTLLVEDPDVKRTFTDASGQLRHVRSFTQPGKLKSYLRKHPEGIILAGVGAFFFIEPVPVSAARIRFDEAGSAEIHVSEEAERIEKQLEAMERISAAAEAAGFLLHDT